MAPCNPGHSNSCFQVDLVAWAAVRTQLWRVYKHILRLNAQLSNTMYCLFDKTGCPASCLASDGDQCGAMLQCCRCRSGLRTLFWALFSAHKLSILTIPNAGRDDKDGKGWRQWMDDRLSGKLCTAWASPLCHCCAGRLAGSAVGIVAHAAVTDAIRQGADGSQMTPDEAAQEKKLPDSAELPMDVGQHRSSADPAHSKAATPSTADLEPELPGLPSTEATAGADESADSTGLRAETAAAEPADRGRPRTGAAAAGPAQSAAGAEEPIVGTTPGSQVQAQGGPASEAQLPLSAAATPAQQHEAESRPAGPTEAAPAAGYPGEPPTVSGSQDEDLAEEDEVMQFTAWVRERLQLQAQEVEAPEESRVEGQALQSPSRQEEDGPHMITGYSGRIGSNTAGWGHSQAWQRVLSCFALVVGLLGRRVMKEALLFTRHYHAG